MFEEIFINVCWTIWEFMWTPVGSILAIVLVANLMIMMCDEVQLARFYKTAFHKIRTGAAKMYKISEHYFAQEWM